MLLIRKHVLKSDIEGIAKTGEISPLGTMEHIENDEGNVEVVAAPSTTHYVYYKSTGELRKKTLKELIDEGKFYVGKGPTGLKLRS